MLTNDTAKVMMARTTRTSKKNHYNVIFLRGKFYGCKHTTTNDIICLSSSNLP